MSFKDKNNNQVYLVVVENQNKDKIDINKLQQDIVNKMEIDGFENAEQDYQILQECDTGEQYSCNVCSGLDEQDKIFNEVIDTYADSILNAGNCEKCIKDILCDFANDVLQLFTVEDEDDDDDGNVNIFH